MVAEQFLVDKDQALGYGILWMFSLPWIVIAGFVGLLTHERFRTRATWVGSTAVFVGTTAVAIAIGLVLSIAFVSTTA